MTTTIQCTFYRPEKVNINEFYNIIGKMEWDLYRACNNKMGQFEIEHYVLTLLRHAKPLERDTTKYFLGLGEPQSMPSDIGVEFFYKPTYLATAFISRFYPEITGGKELGWAHSNDSNELQELLKNVFPGLLKGCTGRRFAGHGFDDLYGVLETLEIFVQAGVEEFVKKYPDICREFTDLYNKTIRNIKDMLKAGTLKNSWGEDYSDKARAILNM